MKRVAVNAEPPTTYTVAEPYDSGFPQNLMIVPNRSDMPDYVKDFYVRHNRTITMWSRHRVGVVGHLTRNEVAVLSLFEAINTYLSAKDYFADNVAPFEWREVVQPLLEAARGALQDDVGRLDQGYMDAWILETARQVGWNLETGEPIEQEEHCGTGF